MIPTVDCCRFASVTKIAKSVLNDDFHYRNLRTIGKVVQCNQLGNEAYTILIEDPLESNSHVLRVNIFLLKGKQIEQGKVYEFLGEVEEETKAVLGDVDMQEPNGEGADVDKAEAEKPEETPETEDQTNAQNAEKLSKILLKAKIVKDASGFHKAVYGNTVGTINNLIECIFARSQKFEKKA